MLQKYAIIASVAAIAAITSGLVLFATPAEAASADGEPTMFVNGINSNQTNDYIYFVPPFVNEFRTSLMIKDLHEKPNVQLFAIDPLGGVTACAPTPVVNSLLVSECTIFGPAPGIWNIQITSGIITNEPLGYSIAADTDSDNIVPTEENQ